ncbi:MAG: hypothetical protein LBG15_10185, partial [Dysgonamonadaceae bacterium]|nr:hypothetical protein [Dysgonamonadaceae bacterium]
SGNSGVISVDENGKMTACPTKDLSATIAIILEDGSVFYYSQITRTAVHPFILIGVADSEVSIGQNSVKKIGAILRDYVGSPNGFNLATLTYAMDDDGNTGSMVTPGGWFRAGATPGAATVTATAKDEDGETFTGTITVTILGPPSAETQPYVTASTNWATLDPALDYAGGDGTEANPYQISSVRQFKKLATDIVLLGSTETTYQKYFELTTDLDFSDDNTVTNTLIGTFYGTFDGKGHLIKNLNIDGTGKTAISLFQVLAYGEIKNLGREGGSITDTNATTPTVAAGGIIYSMTNGGKLTNCYNSSSINGCYYGGGLLWAMSVAASIENCYNIGDITTNRYSGGLIGTCGSGNLNIINSYNYGNIFGKALYNGGLIGILNTPIGKKQILNANNVFNFGNVATSTSNTIGSILGLIAEEINSSLIEVNATNLYSRPDVVSNNSVIKSNQPIGWDTSAREAIKNAILAANPTFENPKYTLAYSKSRAFAAELGGAFKYASERTPKLAWEK